MQRMQFAYAGEPVMLISDRDVDAVLDMNRCIEAVEEAFRMLAAGAAPKPGVLGFEAGSGGFHLKAALDGDYFAAKGNENYPGNPERGLPTIQGLIMLCGARDGRPLAVIDSAEVTALRTGAATGVAAKYLTPHEPLTV